MSSINLLIRLLVVLQLPALMASRRRCKTGCFTASVQKYSGFETVLFVIFILSADKMTTSNCESLLFPLSAELNGTRHQINRSIKH